MTSLIGFAVPSLVAGGGVVAGGAGGASATTWNPSDKAADITLSGGNLIATNNTSNFNDTKARTVGSISGTDKKYWETQSTVNEGQTQVGVGNATMNLNAGNLQNTVHAAGYKGSDGALKINSSGITIATYSTNNIGFAVDFANGRLWARVNGGNWNNDGSADPATNTNGFDISSISGALYPACYMWYTGDSVTGIFSSASWVYSAPSGFSQIT